MWAMMTPTEQASAQAARLHSGADPADYLGCGRRQDLTTALTSTHDLTQVVVDQHLAASAAFLTARMSEHLDPQTITDEIIAAHLAPEDHLRPDRYRGGGS
ncbi:hypothetical protein NKG05_04805 [Oerskovia sp. M15]